MRGYRGARRVIRWRFETVDGQLKNQVDTRTVYGCHYVHNGAYVSHAALGIRDLVHICAYEAGWRPIVVPRSAD